MGSGGACVLINWREGGDTKPLPNLGELKEPEEAREALLAYFPLIEVTWQSISLNLFESL